MIGITTLMNSPAAPLTTALETENDFQTSNVVTITSGHFIHDTFTAFLAPLLPQLIEKLSLSLTQAGSLSAIMQLPALLNPLIGYLDDKVNLRLLVILAPAVTASMMSLMGLAPSYAALVLLLFITGMSSALFHATAPAMVARISGQQVGKGMSFFMAAGELGRTLGPLLATWAFTAWALEGMARLLVLGWASSLVIYVRFRDIPLQVQKQTGFRQMLPAARRLFIPLLLLVFARSFVVTSLGVYMPTLLQGEGASLWKASGALTIYQFAGVVGALTGGTISDRLGRKPVLFAVTLFSPFLMLAFLNTQGWLWVVVLLVTGLLGLSGQPILLALVQDYLPQHRSVANGFFMAMSFIALSLTSVLIGALADRLGLHQAFFWSAIIGFGAVPFVFLLPAKK